jgi:CDP-diacylglycerol--serine O-phosphatidyltransferase
LPDESSDKVKIFVLPTFFTAGNLFCGYKAVITIATGKFAVLPLEKQYHFYRQGILFIMFAFVFDFLDGVMARLVKRESAFGRELDSLADLISFGMAPALLVASIVLEDFPRLGWVVAFGYLSCGAMRLARFNILPPNLLKEFVGFPIPAAAGVTMSMTLFILWLNEHDQELGKWKWAILLIMVLLSFMMISHVRYPSFKNLNWTMEKPFRTVVVLVIVVALIAIHYQVGLAVIFVSYLLYGLMRPWIRRNIRREIELDEEEETDAGPPVKPAS